MTELVVVFPRRDDEVLLGKKKPRENLGYENLGEGLWNGLGGHVEGDLDARYSAEVLEKLEEDPAPTVTAVRELFEETGEGLSCTEGDLEEVARLTIHSPKRETVLLHAYIVYNFEGTLRESKEMSQLEWFKLNGLPKERWKSDEVWLERVFAGEKLIGEIWLDENDALVRSTVQPW